MNGAGSLPPRGRVVTGGTQTRDSPSYDGLQRACGFITKQLK
jgi:hypothetical protein